MSILSAAILLFLVMDPTGNIPLFVTLLGGMPPHRARRIVVRELLIALAVLTLFLLGGRAVLDVLQISEPALSIAGGVILSLNTTTGRKCAGGWSSSSTVLAWTRRLALMSRPTDARRHPTSGREWPANSGLAWTRGWK